MSSPMSIEIAWGGGRWNGGHKEATRPYVETALCIAEDGLDYLDIESHEPKRATVWQVVSRVPEAGSSTNKNELELYIPYKLIRYRKVQRYTTDLSLTSFHELIHCVRSEAVPSETLLEFAATEGVAGHAEVTLATELLKPSEIASRYDAVSQQFAPAQEQWLLHALLEDTAEEEMILEKGGGWSQIRPIHDLWFGAESAIGGVPAGVTLGLMAVGRLIQTGASLSEITSMPTEDIMNFAL